MPWLITLVSVFPLAGFLFNIFLKKNISKSISGVIASGMVFLSFSVSLVLFFTLKKPETTELFTWFSAGNLHVPIEFLADPLSVTMLLIITGIGFLIHVYSIGYMWHDDRFHTFFAYLNLFIFFMVLLVTGANYVMMFIGWEGVGICSYLLIGFWYKNKEYSYAARKAFVMNRIGDFGLLFGIILIFLNFGSLSFSNVLSLDPGNFAACNDLTLITFCLFIGAIGKSAQIPLFTWLPDAMAGPTPVSALIHAATMVTAGIYLIARSGVMFSYSEITMNIVAVTGLITALFAATIGIFQNDIKKVLAYSTVSQLGYMFLALGLGAYSAAVFHVVTHAFFKALLFLGAGSVIHAMSGEQNIKNMGGLRKALPVTFFTFVAGTIAIAGLPPFSGFFSKDEILVKAFDANPWLWVAGLAGALLTAFYMFRLFFLTFYGNFRGTDHQRKHLHESPLVMTLPLVVLALFSIFGGFINIPALFGGNSAFAQFLNPSINQRLAHIELSHSTEWIILSVSIVLILSVIYFAYYMFVKRGALPSDESEMNGLRKLIYKKYYVDELYTAVFVKPYTWVADNLLTAVEKLGINSLTNSIGNLFPEAGKYVRLIQSGEISFYMFLMIGGIVAIIFFKMIL